VLDLLVKYAAGDLVAIWAGWDASALGAFQATQEAGRPEVLVTGVDGQDFARAEVAKDMNWIATVRQDWPTIATTLADILDAHFAGTDPAESTVFVPGVLITAENAE
jgi:ribose transport system substrate-binding protein